MSIINRYLPDYAGFVFAKSKRRVSEEKAKELIKVLDGQIKTCGIFVDEDVDKTIRICQELELDVIQLHGRENDGYIKIIRDSTDARIWKSFSAVNGSFGSADKILIDSDHPGSGKSFDWDVLKGLEGQMKDIIVAGGLDPENISKLLRHFKPYCVDVSSGVEVMGIKNDRLIKNFIENVRRTGYEC